MVAVATAVDARRRWRWGRRLWRRLYLTAAKTARERMRLQCKRKDVVGAQMSAHDGTRASAGGEGERMRVRFFPGGRRKWSARALVEEKRVHILPFFSSMLKVRRDDGDKTASSVGGTFVSGVAGTEGEAEREGIAAAV